MNGHDDDPLGSALREEAGRDLPGARFERRVMEAVEEERERVRLAGPRPSPARRIFGLAAAIGFVALGVWAVATGQLRRPGPDPAAETELATGGVDLPPAETGVPRLRPLRITVTAANAIRLEGRAIDGAGDLPAALKELRGGAAPRAFAERDVVLRIDRRVRWRVVEAVLFACADPAVGLYRLHFAVAGPKGVALLPEFLPRAGEESPGTPRDGGETPIAPGGIGSGRDFVSDAPFESGHLNVTIGLDRSEADGGTEIQLLDTRLGRGRPAFAVLGRSLARLLRSNASLSAELRVGLEVPWEDVIRAVDLWRQAGGGNLAFRGRAPAGDSGR